MIEQADWDIVTGVGLTALAVAAARAMEWVRPDSLVRDPYAEAFVRAARPPVPLPTGPEGPLEPVFVSFSSYLGVRSKFFDDYFAVPAAGLEQVVVLAAGLDCRAFRLPWPAATTLYELDAPKVLEFKDGVLADEGAQPRCRRRTVPVDLRGDWPTALAAAGLRPDRPTAWLAEGLLPYLPHDAQERLLRRLHERSVPGSRVALEHFDGDVTALLDDPALLQMAENFGVDLAQLWPADQGLDAPQWLADHGWSVTTTRALDAARAYGRSFDETITRLLGPACLTVAHLEEPTVSAHERAGPVCRPRDTPGVVATADGTMPLS